MESDNTSQGPSTDAILLSAQSGENRVELVEEPDGTFSLTLNDEAFRGYRWDAGRVEDGVSMFMRIISVNAIQSA